ncbi:MAG TPA: O-methyltransferase [Acidimicrobiia bacterium]|nr:O-methyltransferase [Acidimicrobiia bacterium]
MPMTPERWTFLGEYADDVFGQDDANLAGLMQRAVEAGLPAISVSADVGRLLKILVSMTEGNLALELGTLAGYSAIWIARGLAPGGKLITIEYNEHHADFAQREFATAGVSDLVEIVRGAALEVLPDLAERLGPASVDFAFIDAVKREYVEYFRLIKPLMKPGGLLVADNVYGTGAGWIDEGHGTDDFNRLIAADPDFDAVATPMREGVLIARRSG